MDARNVTIAHAAKIHARLVEPARYLAKLRNRMVDLCFAIDDPLMRKVYLARVTMQDLVNELHAKAYVEAYSSKSASLGRTLSSTPRRKHRREPAAMASVAKRANAGGGELRVGNSRQRFDQCVGNQ
jgi:hypothetical protein